MQHFYHVNINVPWDNDQLKINGKWEVTFNLEYTIGGNIQTFCSIRKEHGVPYAGATIFNHHDRYDEKVGMWWAFRRALSTYLMTRLPVTLSKHGMRQIRSQFYKQMFGGENHE